MKKCMIGFGLVVAVGIMVGCASRTRFVAGPVQVAGEVQVFETPQATSFELGLRKIGFTVGHLGGAVESHWGPCEKVIAIQHSTGDPTQVFVDVPPLN